MHKNTNAIQKYLDRQIAFQIMYLKTKFPYPSRLPHFIEDVTSPVLKVRLVPEKLSLKNVLNLS